MSIRTPRNGARPSAGFTSPEPFSADTPVPADRRRKSQKRATATAIRELEFAAEAHVKAAERVERAVRAALEAGATQAEVAKVLGVSRQAISKRAARQ